MFDISPIILGLSIAFQTYFVISNQAIVKSKAARSLWAALLLIDSVLLIRELQPYPKIDSGTAIANRSAFDILMTLGLSVILPFLMIRLQKVFTARSKLANELDLAQAALDKINGASAIRGKAIEDCVELSKSELKFRSIVEAFGDAIIVTNSANEMVYWNAGALRMFAYRPEEVLGKPVSMILAPECRETQLALMRDQKGKPGPSMIGKAIERRCMRSDGETFFIEMHLSSWSSDEGLFYTGIIRDVTEKKQVQEERDQFFNVSLDMLAMADTDGYFKNVNPVVVDVLGYTPEEFCSNHASYYLHPDDVASTVSALEAQVRGEKITSFENRYRCKDGSYKWLSWKSVPIGRVTYGVARDITLLKEAEAATLSQNQNLVARIAENAEELVSSRERLNTLVANPNVMLWSTDMEGRFTFIDGKTPMVLGVEFGDLIGKSVFDSVHGDPEISDAIKRAMAGEICVREMRMDQDWFEVHYAPMHNSKGEIVGINGVTLNITERKNSESALILAEQRLSTILKNAPVIIFAVDESGIISYSRGLALESLGLKQDGNKGRSIFEVYASNTWLTESVKKALNGDVSNTEGMIANKRFQLYLSPQPTGGMLGLCIDISERETVEAERAALQLRERTALEASRMKSEFLAHMSHEIRTPINGIVGMTSLLLETNLSATQKDYAESVQVSAEALLVIINDILDFSKVEAGKLDLETVDFQLSQIINETSRSFSPVASHRKIEFKVENSIAVSRFFKGDPGRLRQILNNLISNALKFTAVGEVVLAVSETADRMIRFEVRDSGIGISKIALSRLFKSFSQADASTSRRFGGTGLGLSISKHLVEMMKGEIHVISQPGSGSTFWFSLPLEAGEERKERLTLASSDARLPTRANARILVAEDNAINQKVVLTMLQNNGFKATAVANGLEVLNSLRSFHYDLILMDCQMPEMDGYEATRKIRTDASIGQQKVPIIALTASAIKGDKEKCLEAGMNDYLSKPVAQKELVASLNKWLGAQALPATVPVISIFPSHDGTFGEKLDLDILRTLRGLGDELLFRNLIQMYIESVPPKLMAIDQAFKHKDRKALAFGANKLKSASASLGAMTIRNICQQIENIQSDSDLEAISHLSRLLFEEFQIARAQLESLSSNSSLLVA